MYAQLRIFESILLDIL